MAYNQCMDTLQVTEIFRSIQGESTYSGLPCGFVRLTGCPLRCRYCDTQYAWDGGESQPLDEVVTTILSFGVALAEITGGEPLAQAATPALTGELLSKGLTVLVETSGALPVDILPEGVIRIMDIKCPDSDMSDRMDWDNITRLNEQDEVKFVLSSRADYEWSRDILARQQWPMPAAQRLFSPAHGRVSPRELAEWILADRLPVRMQVPLHRVIWPADQRGV